MTFDSTNFAFTFVKLTYIIEKRAANMKFILI